MNERKCDYCGSITRARLNCVNCGGPQVQHVPVFYGTSAYVPFQKITGAGVLYGRIAVGSQVISASFGDGYITNLVDTITIKKQKL